MYGGPLTLKNKSKLFVYIPYNFSTMKVFQNANYGILTAIPTPRFYLEFIMNKTDLKNLDPAIIKLVENKPDWTEYFDVYNSKYIDMYVLFDNFDQLVELIEKKDLDELKLSYRNINRIIMNRHKREVDQKWNEFFHILKI